MFLPKYKLRKYLFAAGCALCILAALAIPLRGIWSIVTGSDPVAVQGNLIGSYTRTYSDYSATRDTTRHGTEYVCTYSYVYRMSTNTYTTTSRTQPRSNIILYVSPEPPYEVVAPLTGTVILVISPFASGLLLFAAWKLRDRAIYG